MTALLPRVHMVGDEEAKGKVLELFEAMKASKGAVPKWMRVMANCDDILLGFFGLFKATMDDAPLESKMKWKLAYYVSELNKCEFCVSVSEMQLKQLGMQPEEMGNLKAAATGREALAFEYVEAVNDHAYKMEPELLERVKAEFSDEELVELTSVVGLFSFINRFNDALGVLPE
ncbi:MAG: hypothetical protein H6773_00385 [Pseudomonadales bacterium]|nr:hypothetical protein [Candidatus Woesebacteria bacterium]MCB9800620.1 hypothetical protein [Pseudomonadales bacterium]